MDDANPATRLADRALLRINGDDVRGFLQGLVTRDVRLVAPGAPQWAGLLTPQGKVLFDFILWDDGDAVLIDCEAAQAEPLARRLAMYRLRRAIEIARVEDAAVHWSPVAPPEETMAAQDPRLDRLGWRWLGALGGSAAPNWHAHRLALGVTEGVAELGNGTTLWLECNAEPLNGVSYDKGCFIWQENTARMHYRAKINRRLVVVASADAAPEPRATYPELGLAVEQRRIEALGAALKPDWLVAALAGEDG